MREIIELILAELRGSWRFRWMAVAAAWALCMGGWGFVYLMPDVYESEATVLFETTSDLDELLKSLTVNADVLSRVETVRTAMLGRPQLERVARRTDLYLRAENSDEMDRLIEDLRQKISLTTARQQGANIYRINYRDREPMMAYSVVSTLLDNFVEETLGANREGSQRAQEFLRLELGDLEADLEAAELRLAEFKRENVGRMPDEQGDYFSRLQTEMSALEATQSELRQARRQQTTLQGQLSGEQSTTSESPQSELDRRIAENERRLEELQLRFTERHPDVIAVKSTLDQLRQQRQQQLAELQEGGGIGATSDNPVFQNIQIELAKVNVEIASLEEQASTHERKIEELQDLVEILPQVEAELARLNRDYDVKQAQYRSLLQRLEVAELSESAERSDQVDFQIIDPPLTPINPVAPNRPLLLAAVLVLGIAAGGGVAFLGNQLKPVFTDPKSLRLNVGLPVLGTIQILDTSERRRKRALQIGSFAGALGALCFLFVVVLFFHESGSQFFRSLV